MIAKIMHHKLLESHKSKVASWKGAKEKICINCFVARIRRQSGQNSSEKREKRMKKDSKMLENSEIIQKQDLENITSGWALGILWRENFVTLSIDIMNITLGVLE